MVMIAFEVIVVVALVAANGFLAMSELAVVSARRGRLQSLAKKGVAGAAKAMALADDPGRFLSSVQIGITLIGIVAGAFSGATLVERLGDYLGAEAMSPTVAHAVAFVVVVSAITYFSLIAGELMPKQIALRNAERVAVAVARPMAMLAAVSAPLVYVLDKSCQLGLRVIGIKASARRVTEDEIRMLIAEAETAGVVEPEEKAMISSVMRLGDRPVRAVMTPRPDVEWIDIGEDREDILRKIRKTPHTRLLIGRGTVEDVAGVVHVKDLLNAYLDGGRPNIGDCVKAAPAIPDTADILEALDLLKASPLRLALVVDEYGTFEGIVTPNDILEAIVGAFPLAAPGHADEAVRRADGSWLVDGSMPIDRFSEQFGIAVPGDADYHTLAGFVLTALRRVPRTTDAFDWAGWRFEVVDMDGRRVDRLLISPAPGGNSAATEPRES